MRWQCRLGIEDRSSKDARRRSNSGGEVKTGVFVELAGNAVRV
jgi:hypothetical protein